MSTATIDTITDIQIFKRTTNYGVSEYTAIKTDGSEHTMDENLWDSIALNKFKIQLYLSYETYKIGRSGHSSHKGKYTLKRTYRTNATGKVKEDKFSYRFWWKSFSGEDTAVSGYERKDWMTKEQYDMLISEMIGANTISTTEYFKVVDHTKVSKIKSSFASSPVYAGIGAVPLVQEGKTKNPNGTWINPNTRWRFDHLLTVTEGEKLSISISPPIGTPAGTTVAWTAKSITAGIDKIDFANKRPYGSYQTSGNTSDILEIGLKADVIEEGDEIFELNIKVDGVKILKKSITIKNKPYQPPVGQWSLTSSKNQVDEGEEFTVTLNVPDGDTTPAGTNIPYKWKGDGVYYTDLNQPHTGNFIIGTEQTKTFSFKNDQATEGLEQAKIILTGDNYASANVSVNDTSTEVDDATMLVSVESSTSPTGWIIDGSLNPPLHDIIQSGGNRTYTFDVSDPSNDTFELTFAEYEMDESPSGIMNSVITDGLERIGTPGTPGAKVKITLDDNSPDEIYYYETTAPNGPDRFLMGGLFKYTAKSTLTSVYSDTEIPDMYWGAGEQVIQIDLDPLRSSEGVNPIAGGGSILDSRPGSIVKWLISEVVNSDETQQFPADAFEVTQEDVDAKGPGEDGVSLKLSLKVNLPANTNIDSSLSSAILLEILLPQGIVWNVQLPVSVEVPVEAADFIVSVETKGNWNNLPKRYYIITPGSGSDNTLEERNPSLHRLTDGSHSASEVYTFDVSDPTNLNSQLKFKKNPLPTTGTGWQNEPYTDPVERIGTPGNAGALVHITLDSNSPDVLYYYLVGDYNPQTGESFYDGERDNSAQGMLRFKSGGVQPELTLDTLNILNSYWGTSTQLYVTGWNNSQLLDRLDYGAHFEDPDSPSRCKYFEIMTGSGMNNFPDGAISFKLDEWRILLTLDLPNPDSGVTINHGATGNITVRFFFDPYAESETAKTYDVIIPFNLEPEEGYPPSFDDYITNDTWRFGRITDNFGGEIYADRVSEVQDLMAQGVSKHYSAGVTSSEISDMLIEAEFIASDAALNFEFVTDPFDLSLGTKMNEIDLTAGHISQIDSFQNASITQNNARASSQYRPQLTSPWVMKANELGSEIYSWGTLNATEVASLDPDDTNKVALSPFVLALDNDHVVLFLLTNWEETAGDAQVKVKFDIDEVQSIGWWGGSNYTDYLQFMLTEDPERTTAELLVEICRQHYSQDTTNRPVWDFVVLKVTQ